MGLGGCLPFVAFVAHCDQSVLCYWRSDLKFFSGWGLEILEGSTEAQSSVFPGVWKIDFTKYWQLLLSNVQTCLPNMVTSLCDLEEQWRGEISTSGRLGTRNNTSSKEFFSPFVSSPLPTHASVWALCLQFFLSQECLNALQNERLWLYPVCFLKVCDALCCWPLRVALCNTQEYSLDTLLANCFWAFWAQENIPLIDMFVCVANKGFAGWPL